MISGNLSWLNLLTIVLAIPALDDRVLGFIIHTSTPELHPPSMPYRIVVGLLAVLVAVLSVRPVANMLAERQIMNTSFNPLHLVGTYGAFGSITRTRYEVVVEGTADRFPTTASQWREYEFRGKPNALGRCPPQVAPYHLRLDWLMWFAAMSSYPQHPWFVHFMGKLLEGDRQTLSLLRTNPFPDHPPRFVRAELYKYNFATPQQHKQTGNWWVREYAGRYFPSVSLDTQGLRQIYQEEGWR
jgi:hypothetical protein